MYTGVATMVLMSIRNEESNIITFKTGYVEPEICIDLDLLGLKIECNLIIPLESKKQDTILAHNFAKY